jgi:zinc transporter 7
VEVVKPAGTSSALEDSPAKSTRSRSKKENGKAEKKVAKQEKEINASVKLAGYLNLMYVLPLSV